MASNYGELKTEIANYIDRDDLLSTMRMLRHRQTGQA